MQRLILGDNGSKLISKLQTLSAREAEELAKDLRPTPFVKDTIQRVVPPGIMNNSQLFTNYIRHEEAVVQSKEISASSPVATASETTASETFEPNANIPQENPHYIRQAEVKEELLKVSFAASKKFIDKLEEAKSLCFRGEKNDVLLENVLSEALVCFLAKHSPKEREARREIRQQKSTAVPSVDQSSRAVPTWLKDKVLKRDSYQCSFVSADGRSCGCKADLEIDHIIPFAKGGKTVIQNFRTLCRTHNYLGAVEVFGEKHVESKIREMKTVRS